MFDTLRIMDRHINMETYETVRTIPGISRTLDQNSIHNTSEPKSNFKPHESLVKAILAKINKDEDLQNWRNLGRSTIFRGKHKAGVSSLAISSFDALRVMAHDISSWMRLYGLQGAIAIVIFGKKSVWKTQVEVLNSPYQLRGLGGPSSGGDPAGNGGGDYSGSDSGGQDDPNGTGGGGGSGGGNGGGGSGGSGISDGDDGFCDQAAREFKDIVQTESNRISLSVCFSNCKPMIKENNRETGCYHYGCYYHRFRSPQPEQVSLGRSRILDIQSGHRSISCVIRRQSCLESGTLVLGQPDPCLDSRQR